MMSNEKLAELYARCFPDDVHHWKGEAIAQLKNGKNSEVVEVEHGAVFFQMAADEGEILSIFIDPAHQGKGEGSRLFNELLSFAAAHGIRTLFLEVAADNQSALKFYTRLNFELIGKRKAYYLRKNGVKVDALTMRCDL